MNEIVSDETALPATAPPNTALSMAIAAGEAVTITCHDGVRLGGHFWPASATGLANQPLANQPLASQPLANVVINPATGVLARYYHRYASFLASHGFDVLTYDYRGIGASRPGRLRGSGYRWRDWGERDCDAALRFMQERASGAPLRVVGHSIGGFLPGLAESASTIDRMLTVGAQYAWWGDYAARRRLGLFFKWHVAMPAATALHGYFPGRRLGWLEDLPAGVANEWSFRGPRFERSHPRGERKAALARMAAVKAPILAVSVTDDELGTRAAVRRTLGYYTGASRTMVSLTPADYRREAIGHFRLFHDSHAGDFWIDTLLWLRDGVNPWPQKVVDL